MRSCLLVLLTFAAATLAQPTKFVVSFPKEALDGEFSGRVVVWLSQTRAEPRFGPNWFRPEPIYSATFEHIKPGDAMTIDDANAIGFPGKLSELPPGEYTLQAVVDRNLGGRTIGGSPGNLFSRPVKQNVSGTIELRCDQIVPDETLVDTDIVKFVVLRSKLLSDFHGRDTFLKAAVLMPDVPEGTKVPTLYDVHGFGGTVASVGRRAVAPQPIDGVPFARVYLDANCPTGHSVFADSDNNGPWGQALTTELIPELERRFPLLPEPRGRFVTGHSSGGWSSLWLQVTYPTIFGGCWSTSPDPVDFRDFQQIDLYAKDANLFTDEHGQPRPIARRGTTPTLFYKAFTQMERPIRGEQIGSFEAVFGPRGKDGEPAHLYDRDTGAIDGKVIEHWKRYDIGLLLRERWAELAPTLAGKIHVYMGDTDTFYLEGAVRLLKRDLEALHADATVELVPGDHGSMMTRALRDRMAKEMADQYRKLDPAGEKPATRPERKAA